MKKLILFLLCSNVLNVLCVCLPPGSNRREMRDDERPAQLQNISDPNRICRSDQVVVSVADEPKSVAEYRAMQKAAALRAAQSAAGRDNSSTGQAANSNQAGFQRLIRWFTEFFSK